MDRHKDRHRDRQIINRKMIATGLLAAIPVATNLTVASSTRIHRPQDTGGNEQVASPGHLGQYGIVFGLDGWWALAYGAAAIAACGALTGPAAVACSLAALC